MIFSGHAALQQMMHKARYRVDAAGCPNAEQVMRHGLMLPCHPTMTGVLDEFIAKRRARA